MTTTTINPQEAAHFGGLASDWWDPKGRSAMLHALNPVRLGWLREQVDAHWGGDPRAMRPLTGKSALDVGCGAGLMCEPLARMGASVTGVDSAPENTAVAAVHAREQGLAITYLAQEVAQVPGRFDLVTAMEVVEHVSDPAAFVAALGDHLKPGGLLIMSTPNRTPLSRMGMIDLAERFGMVPPGTHHWDQFITPDELGELLAVAGMKVVATKGIAWSLTRGLHLSDSLAMNYLVAALRSQ
jgi:2-polyprenyl-6-hydroxyphenyl methylase/3-demethylubiquinone-9 3-methyltransferase